jgi:hypothetical protein
MMPCNDKILVSCDPEQKNTIFIDGKEFSTALKFEVNYREKSPTIATVVHGNAYVKEGDMILCHHNTFHLPSPYHVQDNLFSIPANGNILFAIIKEGGLSPIYDNVLCEKIEEDTLLPIPDSHKKYSHNKASVKDAGLLPFKKGQIVMFRPFANYDIVYVYNGVEARMTKVFSPQICGVVTQS